MAERGPWKAYVVQEKWKFRDGQWHWFNHEISFSWSEARGLLKARFSQAVMYRKHKPSRRRFRVKAFVLTEVDHG